jgi:hypothetical protein
MWPERAIFSSEFLFTNFKQINGDDRVPPELAARIEIALFSMNPATIRRVD